MNRKPLIIVPVLLALLFLSACGALYPQATLEPANQAATQDAIIRQAVQATATTMAMETEVARLRTQVAGVATGQPESPTLPPETGVPTDTLVPTATLPPPADTPVPPTATLPPTSTPVPPTSTPIIPTFPPSATALPCNAAQFVQDVTIPDGSTLSANATFTKTWRLRNTGACTWTNTYDIVFTGGHSMSGPTVVDLPGNVLPGQVIDVSVDLTAPSGEGHYRGDWKLRDSAGVIFGLGRTGASFYVDIRVAGTSANFSGDFVSGVCQAEWGSGAGTLSCSGASNDSRGYVYRVDSPTLESGYLEDESALLTHPQMVNDGIIRGKYPAMRIESGHHFRAIIGCTYETSGCDVNFQLDYQIGSGPIQTLRTWHEVYDKTFAPVDVDLSSLAGSDVRLILTVLANGSSNNDKALWLAPRVVK